MIHKNCRMQPLEAESHNSEDGGADDGLGDHHLGITSQISQSPGILNPYLIELEGHSWKYEILTIHQVWTIASDFRQILSDFVSLFKSFQQNHVDS